MRRLVLCLAPIDPCFVCSPSFSCALAKTLLASLSPNGYGNTHVYIHIDIDICIWNNALLKDPTPLSIGKSKKKDYQMYSNLATSNFATSNLRRQKFRRQNESLILLSLRRQISLVQILSERLVGDFKNDDPSRVFRRKSTTETAELTDDRSIF